MIANGKWITYGNYHWDIKHFIFLHETDFGSGSEINFLIKEGIACVISRKILNIHLHSVTNKMWKFTLKIFGNKVNERIEHEFLPLEEGKTCVIKIPQNVLRFMKNTSVGIVELQCTYYDDDETVHSLLNPLNDAGKTSSTKDHYEHTSQRNAIEKLTKDLKHIFDSSLYTDVKFQFKADTISAHKAILCGRSAVFCKMFEHETAEKTKSVIEITDVESGIFKKFLAFIYSCELGIEDVDTLCGLYYVADKYEVLDLRVLCGETLLSVTNTTNACKILALADRHDDRHLKNKTLEFMNPRLKEITESADWKEYIDSKLAAEIIINSREVQ